VGLRWRCVWWGVPMRARVCACMHARVRARACMRACIACLRCCQATHTQPPTCSSLPEGEKVVSENEYELSPMAAYCSATPAAAADPAAAAADPAAAAAAAAASSAVVEPPLTLSFSVQVVWRYAALLFDRTQPLHPAHHCPIKHQVTSPECRRG